MSGQGIAEEFSAKLTKLYLKKMYVEDKALESAEKSLPNNGIELSLKVSFKEEQSSSMVDQQIITAEFYIDANKTLESHYLNVNVIYSATFIISPRLNKDELEEFVNVNAFAIVFPFIREAIYNVTSRCSTGAIVIPIINFIRRFHELKTRT